MKNKVYDYEKYIWRIQFEGYRRSLLPHRNITIDYLNRKVIYRYTDEVEKVVHEKVYEVAEEQFNEIMELSLISTLREFENKSEEELNNLECGYRDEGFYEIYSYFTHDNPPRNDGILNWIYSGSPFEELLRWACSVIGE